MIVFNPAFYAIWKEPRARNPYDHEDRSNQTDHIKEHREHIVSGLTKIIESEAAPREVQSFFLDLAQFLEHCDADKEKLESIGRSLAAFGGLEVRVAYFKRRFSGSFH